MKKEFNIFNSVSPSKKPSVSDDYFNQLEKELLSKVGSSKTKEVSMFKKPSFWMGLLSAACIGFIVILSSKNDVTIPVADKETLSLESISTQEVESYISENLDDIEMLAEIIEPQENISLTNQVTLDKIEIETIESYLEDYFVEDENKDV